MKVAVSVGTGILICLFVSQILALKRHGKYYGEESTADLNPNSSEFAPRQEKYQDEETWWIKGETEIGNEEEMDFNDDIKTGVGDRTRVKRMAKGQPGNSKSKSKAVTTASKAGPTKASTSKGSKSTSQSQPPSSGSQKSAVRNSYSNTKADPRSGGAQHGKNKKSPPIVKIPTRNQAERQVLKQTSRQNANAKGAVSPNTGTRGNAPRVSQPINPATYNPRNVNTAGKYPGGVIIGGEDQKIVLDKFTEELDLTAARASTNGNGPTVHLKQKSRTNPITRSDLNNGNAQENIDLRLQHPRNGVMAGSTKNSKTGTGRSRDVSPVFARTENGRDTPLNEMMIGVLTAKATDGSTKTFVAASGGTLVNREQFPPNSFNQNKGQLLPMQYQRGQVTLTNTQVKNTPIVNVLTGQESPTASCTTNCAAQKLFSALGQHVKENQGFKIAKPSDISMREQWYRAPGTSARNRDWDQIQPVKSCTNCQNTLPHFFGQTP